MKIRSQGGDDDFENYDPYQVYSLKNDEEEADKRAYRWLEGWDCRLKGFLPLHFDHVNSISSSESIQQKIQRI
jgi:hypothetical protein